MKKTNNETTLTCSSNNGIESGDALIMQTMRHSTLEKVLALVVGLLYYKHLPRSLKQFIKTKEERYKVTSVSNTTLTIS